MLRQRPRTTAFRGLALAVALTVVAPALASSGLASPAAAEPLPRASTVERISGADRYATSVAASRAAFPGTSTPDVVYLVSGATFADAIAAGPVAAHVGGGLLLTASTTLPPVIADELRRLSPERIVIVGGTGAVSAAVESAAAAIAPVERVGGVDRYETARLLVRSAFAEGTDAGAATVYLATGANFPDALAAGPAASTVDAPVLLVPGTGATLGRATTDLLDDLGVADAVIVGGTGVVSTAIENDLRATLGGSAVTRFAGDDRYTTARAVSDAAFGPASGRIIVASGTSFPDALSITVFAARAGLPLYLTLPYCVPSTVSNVFSSAAVTERVLIGGAGALSPGVERLEPCRSITSPSSLWVLVNKQNPLPIGYVPAGMRRPSIPNPSGALLRSEAATALERMVAGAQAAGAGQVGITSGYRSGSSQAAIYAASVRNRGQAYTDLYVARAGHSEHQTGLTADLYPIGAATCSSYRCLGATPQGRWLAQNAWRYGFILRYEEGMTAVTGYGHESWHFRYLGPELAADYAASGHRAFESFLGQPAAPRY